jgi:uncharacterized membrane protein SpoIIM required for sporulation
MRATVSTTSRSTETSLLVLAMSLSLVLMVGGFLVGFGSLSHLQSGAGGPEAAGAAARIDWLTTFGTILARNGLTLCLLFSGVMSGGLTTLIAWPLVSVFIGSTMRLSESMIGLDSVLGAIWPYAPLEFLALAVAAGAGLLPVTNAIRASLADPKPGAPVRSPFQAYLGVFPLSLRMLLVSGTILLIAAAIEATVVAAQGVS